MVVKSPTKKVCMLAYTLYRYDNRVRREAETLAALQDYQVLILTPKEGEVQNTYKLNGVSIREMNMRQYQGKSKLRYIVSYVEFIIRAFFICNTLILYKESDIFHVHNMPNFLIFSAILARVCGKNLLLDIHDSVPETYATKFNKSSNRVLFRLLCLEEAICSRLAHKIICVNHPQRDILVGRGIPPQKILVSLNVPDMKWFKTSKSIPLEKVHANAFKLVYHGTLAKRLGIDIIIEAVSKLVHSITNIEFHIYGDGDDKEELIRLAIKLGLQKIVYFHGLLQIEELFPRIKQMDVGVIGNRKNIATELMLPVKMLECIALDVPVIVPNLKTIQYYFSDDMVTYFEAEDCHSLVTAILLLYHDKKKREIQVQLAKKFLEKFDWEKHQKEFLDLYSHL